jgi:glutathione peroxidase
MNNSIYQFSALDINHNEVQLSEYKGKVLLIVNVASQCGFTPQYKGLEKLYKEFQGKVAVLGFPCNQFGKQEPGDEEEIKTFCSLNYEVTFPMFSKIDVNGEQTHPLYEYLKNQKKGLLGTEAIKWNFTKFLIDQNGKVLKRYAPTDTPESIKKDIEDLLK